MISYRTIIGRCSQEAKAADCKSAIVGSTPTSASDGLTFAELVFEAASRLPRDTSVVAVLPAVSQETAFAPGSLRRRGYAVTAVIVIYDQHQFAQCAGPLLTEGIPCRRVNDEAALSALCREQMLQAM